MKEGKNGSKGLLGLVVAAVLGLVMMVMAGCESPADPGGGKITEEKVTIQFTGGFNLKLADGETKKVTYSAQKESGEQAEAEVMIKEGAGVIRMTKGAHSTGLPELTIEGLRAGDAEIMVKAGSYEETLRVTVDWQVFEEKSDNNGWVSDNENLKYYEPYSFETRPLLLEYSIEVSSLREELGELGYEKKWTMDKENQSVIIKYDGYGINDNWQNDFIHFVFTVPGSGGGERKYHHYGYVCSNSADAITAASDIEGYPADGSVINCGIGQNVKAIYFVDDLGRNIGREILMDENSDSSVAVVKSLYTYVFGITGLKAGATTVKLKSTVEEIDKTWSYTINVAE